MNILMDNKETVEEEGINIVKVEPSATDDDEILVDWRGRACLISSNKHGGITAAAFVLGLQAFEMMAIAAVGNNLITYVFNEMHFPLSKSANIVTNFVGTVFLLSLLGGFLSDSYLGSLRTMFIFGFIELSGFVLLAVQAHLPGLQPPKCSMMAAGHYCLEAKGYKAGILFLALSLVALGSGCLKPNIISHGADQFRKKDSKRLSSYFNCAYMAFCSGELVALTVLVWVQTQSGMDVGFGVSAGVMAVGMICLISGTPFYANKRPRGSIFTPIAQVFVAAITKRKQICPSQSEMLNGSQEDTVPHNFSGPSPNATTLLLHTQKFRFLDKACVRIQNNGVGGGLMRESPWRLCSVSQVEQVKILISVVPIFACTIIFNTILAQLQTFSVQQGVAMDTRISDNFRIPPASLQSIPYIMLIFVVPLYETCFVPIARKMTGKESGISPLQRVGVGLFVATFSMVSAAVVENKRRNSALNDNKTLSIFWVAPQFLIFGVSEMFTAVGLVEFFYKQSVEAGLQSFLTAMTYCSYSFGFYLSSLLVSLVNRITCCSCSSSSSSSSSGGGGGGWLSDNDLNKDRLDLFYWLLAALSLINFFNYIFWSRWYSYNNNNPSSSSLSASGYGQESHHDDHGGILKHNTVGVVNDSCYR